MYHGTQTFIQFVTSDVFLNEFFIRSPVGIQMIQISSKQIFYKEVSRSEDINVFASIKAQVKIIVIRNGINWSLHRGTTTITSVCVCVCFWRGGGYFQRIYSRLFLIENRTFFSADNRTDERQRCLLQRRAVVLFRIDCPCGVALV